MSEGINEAPRNKDDAAPKPADLGDAEADAELTMVNGQWDIKLHTTKTIQSQSDGQASGATVTDKEVSMTFHGYFRTKEDHSPEAQRRRWFKEMRGWLMVLATVAASASYQAGLNPPGGFWQDNPQPASGSLHVGNLANQTHNAGDPVLRDEHRSRYLMFFYFNATAFVTSLVIMVLLMSERFYHTEAKVVALMFTTFVDLASLIGAYIAGTTRYFSSCIYVIVITCVAFVGVICIGEVMTEICVYVMVVFPCMEALARNNWCPLLPGVMKKAKKKKEEMEQRKSQTKNKMEQHNDPGPSNTRTCCVCCA